MRKIEVLENGDICVNIGLKIRKRNGHAMIIPSDVTPQASIIAQQIARAFRWQKFIDEGKFNNALELAKFIGRDPAQVSKILRLTLLSPQIIHAALNEELPESVGLASMLKTLPIVWADQEEMFGVNPEKCGVYGYKGAER